MCNGSEAGSYLRLLDFGIINPRIGVIKKKKKRKKQQKPAHAFRVWDARLRVGW